MNLVAAVKKQNNILCQQKILLWQQWLYCSKTLPFGGYLTTFVAVPFSFGVVATWLQRRYPSIVTVVSGSLLDRLGFMRVLKSII